MKRSDLIRALDAAEHFLRSGLARNVSPLDMAEHWAGIHRIRSTLTQDTESLPPVTALEPKDATAQYRHVRPK